MQASSRLFAPAQGRTDMKTARWPSQRAALICFDL